MRYAGSEPRLAQLIPGIPVVLSALVTKAASLTIGCEYSPAFGAKKEKAKEDKVKVSNCLWLLFLIQAQPCSTNSNARLGQLEFVCG